MSSVFGVCLSFVGVVRMFQVLEKGPNYLKKDVELLSGQNDTKCKQIARIVANVLYIIGLFSTAVGMIAMGASMIALAPEMVFLVALQEAVMTALPYLGASLATLSASLIIRQIAR